VSGAQNASYFRGAVMQPAWPNGQAGFLIFQSEQTIMGVTNFDELQAGGVPVGTIRRNINLAAASQALTAAQSGQRFVGVVDAVFTLPAISAAMKGVWYEFACGALSAGVGLSISPAAADYIGGNGLGVVVNKDLINSGATDRLGDMVRIECDGVAWWITAVIGTFAKEA
jgi:hypothetical protein